MPNTDSCWAKCNNPLQAACTELPNRHVGAQHLSAGAAALLYLRLPPHRHTSGWPVCHGKVLPNGQVLDEATPAMLHILHHHYLRKMHTTPSTTLMTKMPTASGRRLAGSGSSCTVSQLTCT
jgi:hypothetical protein